MSNDLAGLPGPIVDRLGVRFGRALERQRLADVGSDQLVLDPNHRRDYGQTTVHKQ